MGRSEQQWREDIIGATADGNRLSGRVFEDGGYWMIEFPSIDVMTQARTRDEICHMAADLLETLVNIPTYATKVTLLDGDRLEVTSNYRSEPSGAGSFSPKGTRQNKVRFTI